MNTITEEEAKQFSRLLDYFKTLASDGVSSLIEKQLLLMLDHTLPFFAHLVLTNGFPIITRLTVNRRVLEVNKRIHEIKHLKYPPPKNVTKYGRCNLPGQSVLYGTFNELIAFNELKPRIGDLVSISVWRMKENEMIKYCPIFKIPPINNGTINPRLLEISREYEKKLLEYPEFMRGPINNLVQFIADGFTKRVPDSNHLDYIFSAYFADKIFNDFENNTIDAIYYPSVQNRLSFENIAIKPSVFDRKYDLIEVTDKVIVVEPTAQGGGYFSEVVGECKSFDYTSGRILWESNPIAQSDERMTSFRNKYGVELK
ncbi:MAG: hypothetical protein ACLQQ4_15155 [Bacteroidia bacterium]